MVSSYPNHSTASRRTKPQHRAAVTAYRLAGSGIHGMTGKVSLSQRASQSRYQTRELLGRGGMAEVYRGVDAQLGRPVAIKRLRPDLAVNPVCRARFRREAEAAGRLSHSAIVAVYDTGEERDATGPSIPFIVMELVQGRSLRDALREEGRVPPVRALELTAGVLDALACSHAAGIIHRDIKPANVMLTDTGGVKVADFGIARAVSDASGTATQAGVVLGTAQYLSPEQGRGEAADARSDIYSVGCMLYELLVGEPPFTADSIVSIVFRHISDPPNPPSAVNPAISADIDAITLKALAKDPADRYQSAAEMKADIDRVLSGQPPAITTLLPTPMIASSEAEDDQVELTNRRKAVRLLAIMIAFILILIGTSIFAIHRSKPPAAAAVRTTEVPAVLGLGKVGVESLLRNAHLVPQFEFVHGAEGAAVDTAIKQSPEGGNVVALESPVTVMINIGPRLASIPGGLIGRDVDQVTKALRQAGFQNIKTEKAKPLAAGVAAGQVILLAPAGGRTVALSEPITVTYAGKAATQPLTRPPSTTSGDRSGSETNAGYSRDSQVRESDIAADAGTADRSDGGGKIKKNFGKAKNGKKAK
jgi:eukaryotic-like serine/threonine-protein kinase